MVVIMVLMVPVVMALEVIIEVMKAVKLVR